jgi:hypothetical protein
VSGIVPQSPSPPAFNGLLTGCETYPMEELAAWTERPDDRRVFVGIPHGSLDSRLQNGLQDLEDAPNTGGESS